MTDDTPAQFTFRPWRPEQESWDTYLAEVETAYALYLERYRHGVGSPDPRRTWRVRSGKALVALCTPQTCPLSRDVPIKGPNLVSLLAGDVPASECQSRLDVRCQ